MTTRTIAYLRISTDKQADRGISLDAQRAKARAYAEFYDLELVEVIVDAGESAKTLDRPGLQRALRMLRDGTAHALLVVKLDRLTRSVAHLRDYVARKPRRRPVGTAALVPLDTCTRCLAGRIAQETVKDARCEVKAELVRDVRAETIVNGPTTR